MTFLLDRIDPVLNPVKHDCKHSLKRHIPRRIDGKLWMVCSEWQMGQGEACSCKFDGTPYEGSKADESIPWKLFFDARTQAMAFAVEQDKDLVEKLRNEINSVHSELSAVKARLLGERIKAVWLSVRLVVLHAIKRILDLVTSSTSKTDFNAIEDALRESWSDGGSDLAVYRLADGGTQGLGRYLEWKDKAHLLIEGCNTVIPGDGSCIMDGSDQYWVENCVSSDPDKEVDGLIHFILKVATPSEYGDGKDDD